MISYNRRMFDAIALVFILIIMGLVAGQYCQESSRPLSPQKPIATLTVKPEKTTAIRSGPPDNEPYLVKRHWKRWRKPVMHDCLSSTPRCGAWEGTPEELLIRLQDIGYIEN